MGRMLKNPSLWIVLVLLLANGMAWAYTLAPEGPATVVEPRLAPQVADLRQRMNEGGHSGEPFSLELTEQEATEMLAWYLDRKPNVPFSEPRVNIGPGGIAAQGVAEIAGLRVGLAGEMEIELRDGVPIVTVGALEVAGVGVPGAVRSRIQAELDSQFSVAQDLPLVIEELVLEEGWGTVRGTIR